MNQIIKNVLGIVCIVVLLIIAGSAIGYVYNYSQVANQGHQFAVTGDGKSYAIPNIANVTVSIMNQGSNDISALQNQNSKKVDAVVTYLKTQAVDAKDITTTSYNLTPQYASQGCPAGGTCPFTVVGYTIEQDMSIKIRDLAKVGTILGGVVKNGANSITQLAFLVDDLSAVQREARAQAIQKAQQKAEEIAAAGGFKLKRVVSVYEDTNPTPYSSDAIGGGGVTPSMMKSFTPTIPSGSQEIHVGVSLIYEIE